MSALRLLNDLAIKETGNDRQDGLGFQTYAQVLGDAALGTEGPFTIGVFGEWGTGKTSLMRLMKSYVGGNENTVTVWFNAWRYEKEEHPIVPLIATIVKELHENKIFTESLSNKGKDLLNSLRAVAYGFSAKSKVALPGIAEIEASFVAKEMIDREEALSTDPLLGRSIYYEAFERLSKTNLGKDKKIVVFIDDLDRCFPDLAIKLLESIKLVLSQTGFVFVIGVARTVIEGYLQHRYEENYGLKNFEGVSYLDKIVQLPFHIPPHRERIDKFCTSLLSQLDRKDKDVFSKILPTIAKTTGGNPRATIRFVNNLLIDRAINLSLFFTGEMEDIPIEFFAVTRILQQRWQKTFSILSTSPETTEIVANWKKEDIIKFAESKNTNLSLIATNLLTDDNLSKLLLSPHGHAWLLENEIRNSTIGFIYHRQQEAENYIENEGTNIELLILHSREDKGYIFRLEKYFHSKNVKYTSYSIPDDASSFEINNFNLSIAKVNSILVCLGQTFTEDYEIIQDIITFIKPLKILGKNIIFCELPGANTENLPPSVFADYLVINLRKEFPLKKDNLQLDLFQNLIFSNIRNYSFLKKTQNN